MAPIQRVPLAVCQTAPMRRSVPYICRSCRSNLLPPPKPNQHQLRRASSSQLPFTEKLRRKIWGTDNPPGLADPYGGPSFLERRRMQNQQGQPEESRQSNQQPSLEPTRPTQADLDDVTVSSADTEVVGDGELKEAETWDGLAHIGHMGDWRDMPLRPEDEYAPWAAQLTRNPPTTRPEVVSCLHQAIVECHNCNQEGEDLSTVYGAEATPEDYHSLILSKIVVSESGYISHVERPEPAEERSGEGSNPYMAVRDEQFLTAKLDFSDSITLPILKRLSRLTGVRHFDPLLSKLSSPTLPQTQTLAYLVDGITRMVTPKPKNLAETLMQKTQLTSQSNVMILPRRETPVDKEKEVGRWKVIERELKSRGLPVLGRVVV